MVNETAPKISASIRRSLTTIQVKWDPSSMTGVKGDIKGFELVYELLKVNGQPNDNPVSTRIVICSNYTEYLLTELSPFAEYKIKIAAVTLEGTGKFSNAVYGGRFLISLQIKNGVRALVLVVSFLVPMLHDDIRFGPVLPVIKDSFLLELCKIRHEVHEDKAIDVCKARSLCGRLYQVKIPVKILAKYLSRPP